MSGRSVLVGVAAMLAVLAVGGWWRLRADLNATETERKVRPMLGAGVFGVSCRGGTGGWDYVCSYSDLRVGRDRVLTTKRVGVRVDGRRITQVSRAVGEGAALPPASDT